MSGRRRRWDAAFDKDLSEARWAVDSLVPSITNRALPAAQVATQWPDGKRRLDDLQKGILDVRMVPLDQVFDKLARLLRRLARDSGKDIDFFAAGGDVEDAPPGAQRVARAHAQRGGAGLRDLARLPPRGTQAQALGAHAVGLGFETHDDTRLGLGGIGLRQGGVPTAPHWKPEQVPMQAGQRASFFTVRKAVEDTVWAVDVEERHLRAQLPRAWLGALAAFSPVMRS